MKNEKEFIKGIYEKYDNITKNDNFYHERIYRKKKVSLLKMAAIFLICICITASLTYAGFKAYQNAQLNANYSEDIAATDGNQIWCGTFQLVWNDAMEKMGKKPIVFKEYSPLAESLNQQKFTVGDISEESYYKIVSEMVPGLKEKIETEIKEKFGIQSITLDDIDFTPNSNVCLLYAMLKKEFTFPVEFTDLGKGNFAGGEQPVTYYGINDDTDESVWSNVEILFYDNKNEFAIRLKTNEKEEVILYRTDNNTSFEEMYQKILEKEKSYTGSKRYTQYDKILKIPNINISTQINYDELCDKEIQGSTWHIEKAIQTVEFSLDKTGGKIISEAELQERTKSYAMEDVIADEREFLLTEQFVLFLKEEDKNVPYFAMHVNDDSVLQ